MKRFILFFMIAITLMSSTATAAVNEPEVEALGAILIDYRTGRVLWAKNADEPLAMASTTKIMTAVIALENGKLDDIVRVSKKAAGTPPVKMHLQPDEEISLLNLLYALMMQSSNDAAVAIAEHIGGDVSGFCQMMNKKAAELGCTDTVFETPNGLDSGNHHSTAADMAKIAQYALANEAFVKIINTPNITVKSNKKTYEIINKNRLLNEFEGAEGIKTGYTGQAGHCFVGAAERNGMKLISVVLASGWGNRGKEQKWVDTKRILKYGFDNFGYVQIIDEAVPVGDLSIERSKTERVILYFEEGCELPLSEEEAAQAEVRIRMPEVERAPVYEGQAIGYAEIYVGGRLYKEIAIFAAEGAERHDLKTSLEKVLNEFIRMGTRSRTGVELPEF